MPCQRAGCWRCASSWEGAQTGQPPRPAKAVFHTIWRHAQHINWGDLAQEWLLLLGNTLGIGRLVASNCFFICITRLPWVLFLCYFPFGYFFNYYYFILIQLLNCCYLSPGVFSRSLFRVFPHPTERGQWVRRGVSHQTRPCTRGTLADTVSKGRLFTSLTALKHASATLFLSLLATPVLKIWLETYHILPELFQISSRERPQLFLDSWLGSAVWRTAPVTNITQMNLLTNITGRWNWRLADTIIYEWWWPCTNGNGLTVVQ